MLTRSRHVPASSGVDLRSLRISLNTPVVARSDFPVGPAAAALAVFGSPGSLRAALVLRSVRGGHVAFLGADAEGEAGDAWRAADAVLSCAEAIGFLFDDELFGQTEDGGAARRAWIAFLGEPAGHELPSTLAAEPAPPLLLSRFRFLTGPPARTQRGGEARVRLLARY